MKKAWAASTRAPHSFVFTIEFNEMWMKKVWESSTETLVITIELDEMWMKKGFRGVTSSTKAPCSFTNDRWKKIDEKNLESDEKITINHDEMWMKKPWMNSQACEGGGAMAMGRMSTFKSLYVVLCATYYFFLLSFCSMWSNFLEGIQNCGIYYKKHSPFLLWMKRKKIEMTCLQMFGFVQSF